MDNKPLPPHSAHAEKATLGALILNPRSIYTIAPLIDAGDFYQEKNRQVYEAITELHGQGQSCDPVTLDSHLSRFSSNGTAWVDYIGELVQYTPDEEAAADYAKIVAEKAARRRLLGASSRIERLARSEDGDIDQQLGEAETVIFSARGGRQEGHNVKPEEYGLAYLKTFDELVYNDREISGMPTGFIDLDRLLNGLQKPHHYVVAGRPAMGKSSLALDIADHVASEGYKVALFALEMSHKQIMDRRVSKMTRLDSQRVQKPWLLSEEERARVYEAVAKLTERQLFIETESGLTISKIRAKAMRLHAEHDIDLMVVDHLHLMKADVPRNRKDLEIDENVRGLTALYKTLGIAGITVSQLSRSVEHRAEKRPTLADFRESGAIEEEAFVGMLLYRDEYYHPDSTDKPNVGEVIVAKNREGPTATVELYWDGSHVSFANLHPDSKEIAL